LKETKKEIKKFLNLSILEEVLRLVKDA